jgi:hypothetical protein
MIGPSSGDGWLARSRELPDRDSVANYMTILAALSLGSS